MMEGLSNVQFYDYTKDPERIRDYINGDLPDNYHLTYSVSEKSLKTYVWYFLENGVNCSVIYRGEMPETLNYGGVVYKDLIDGDEHDLRFLDRPGCPVMLKLKQPYSFDSGKKKEVEESFTYAA